jgi:hypothetical protein
MISEQTALHTPSSALQFRQLTDLAVTVNDPGIRPAGSRTLLPAFAEQARSLTTRMLGALSSVWSSYITAHTFTLDNGTTVWIDEYQTFVIDPGQNDTRTTGLASMSDYDQWLQAQAWGW